MDAHRRFYVKGELTKPENLEQKLREELARRIVWTVYVEGDGDSVFEDTFLRWMRLKDREEKWFGLRQ